MKKQQGRKYWEGGGEWVSRRWRKQIRVSPKAFGAVNALILLLLPFPDVLHHLLLLLPHLLPNRPQTVDGLGPDLLQLLQPPPPLLLPAQPLLPPLLVCLPVLGPHGTLQHWEWLLCPFLLLHFVGTITIGYITKQAFAHFLKPNLLGNRTRQTRYNMCTHTHTHTHNPPHTHYAVR